MDPVRVRLDLGYDGTAFAGWARQPGLRTVAGVLEAALARVVRLDAPPTTVVAGRTDAGVHARGQVVHVDLPASAWGALPGRSARSPEQALVRSLAAVLPADVRVFAVSQAPVGFDARFSALARHYAYRLSDAPGGPDPLRRHDVVTVAGGSPGHALDVEAMSEAARRLEGLHDFAAFCRAREGATTIRTLLRYRWHRVASSVGGPGDVVVADVVADAFCHSMVRALVGAVLAVGQGRRAVDWPARVLTAGVRDGAVQVAPARGLVLERVDYPPDVQLAERVRQARARRDATEVAWQPAGMSAADPHPDGTDHDGVLEMADEQDDRYTSAQLDQGYSPRERPANSAHYGLSVEEELAGSTLDQRLREEEPDVSDAAPDADWAADSGAGSDDRDEATDEADDIEGELLDDQVGDRRAGRLVAPDAGVGEDAESDAVASDVGLDGGAASAEEAAMHIVGDDDDDLAD